jgi:hypothetical protein
MQEFSLQPKTKPFEIIIKSGSLVAGIQIAQIAHNRGVHQAGGTLPTSFQPFP